MVRKSLTSPFRRASLVFSLFGGFVLQDPNDLLGKVRLRLSQKGISIPAFRIPAISPEGEALYAMGEYSASAAVFEANGWAGKLRAQKIRSQIDELNSPIIEGQTGSLTGQDTRVLFYLTNSKPFTNSGYTERSQFILRGLNQSGIPVRGVTRLGYPTLIGVIPLRDQIEVLGVQYKFLLPSSYPFKKEKQIQLAVDLLVREARRFNATVLHTTTDFKNAIVVSRAAEQLGIPWLYEARGELEKTWLSKRPKDLAERASASEFFKSAQLKEIEAMRKANAVIVLSEVSKGQAVKRGIPEEKIWVVPNAISETDIYRTFDREEVRKELGLPEGRVVGAITSLVGYEGLDDLIRAIPLIEDANFVIVGDGEARRSLEALSHELRVDDRVSFVGKQPSTYIWKWYASLDVLVVPRKDFEVTRTVTPIKTLVAQGLGTPVVASDLPALREVTGGHAVYSNAQDPDSLADAIISVLKMDVKELGILRSKGREWVKSRTWNSNVEQLTRVYRSLPDLSRY